MFASVPGRMSAPLRDCISYYNGHGEASPGSLAYYGGGGWHKWRRRAQESMEPYVRPVFAPVMMNVLFARSVMRGNHKPSSR